MTDLYQDFILGFASKGNSKTNNKNQLYNIEGGIEAL
jgi:hypothetical protein